MPALRTLGVTAAIMGFADMAPLSGARADGMQTTHRLSAEMASDAVRETVMHCAGQGYSEIAVLVDADGVRQAVLRGDRAGSHSLDSAFEGILRPINTSSDNLLSVEGSMIDAVLIVAVFAALGLCIIGFGAWARKRVP